MRIFVLFMLSLGICALTAAQSADTPSKAAKTEQSTKAKADAPAEAAKNKNKKAKPKAPAKPPEPAPGPQPVVHDLAAMKKVVRVIRDSVDLSPTLVVWLIDRTTSAHNIV